MFDASTHEGIGLPVPTLTILLFLGPAVVAWVVVEAITFIKRDKFGQTGITLLRCATILAAVLALCYVCEHHFYSEHATKVYRPAVYWIAFGVVLLVSVFTLTKSHSNDFMNREQTEEWKGWMQFLFIQYHYWKMETAYKDIRVYITCYLWMTGFGNFVFFYTKRDFSLLRVLQMVWRMNFFVFFLCLTMDNPYIVYYICPLHTFFFFVTYVTMAVWSEVNHREYGMHVKVAVVLALFIIVYDLLPRIFHAVFRWLGTESTHAPIGGHGVEWEWYFRSFLDHYSTIWGMIFAMNMPFLATWFKKVESLEPLREWGIKLSLLACMVVMFALWVHYVYSRDKFDYNAIHSYYGIVPLLTYLMIRNISKTFRGYYLWLLHWFGTITLECYLLQYHIWLADNAGKLLDIVPGQWLLNFLIASCLHVLCAVGIFNITNKLRDIFLPNDLGLALRNLAWLFGSILVCFAIARGLIRGTASPLHLIWLILGAGAVQVVILSMIQSAAEISDKRYSTVKWVLGESHAAWMAKAFYCGTFVACLVVTNAMLRGTRYYKQQHAGLFQPYASPPGTHALNERVPSAEEYVLDFTVGSFDFLDSQAMGRSLGFVVGSLAQKWHGLITVLAALLCIVAGDSYFGITRLFLFIWAPEGKRTITREEAFGPLHEKLGLRPKDAAPTETTPLQASPQAAA